MWGPIDSPTKPAKEALHGTTAQFAGLAATDGHSYPGSEHILIGLLGASDSSAMQAFRAVGMDISAFQKELLVVTADRGGDAPFEYRALAIVTDAIKLAKDLGHPYFGTEHVMLSVLDRPEALGTSVLARFVARDALRSAVYAAVGGDGPALP